LQRFVRHGRPHLAGDGAQSAAPAQPGAAGDPAGPAMQASRQRPETVPAGPLRLASPFLAGQTGWLLPLLVFGLVAAPLWPRPALPLSPTTQAIFLWVGWAASDAAIFSGAGGIFHAYYLDTLAPPLAALAALAATSLWRGHGSNGWRSLALPGALLATAAWQYVIAAGFPGTTDGAWWPWLGLVPLCGAALAILALLVPSPWRARLAPAGLGIGLVALLALPAAWALSSVVVASHVEFPYAGAWQRTAAEDPAVRRVRTRQIEDLLAFLRENRHGERFLVATPDARRAAPLIIASGEAVMAMGGYMGADAILTPETLRQMAARRELRFIMIVPDDERGQRASHAIALAEWVRRNGRLVDPVLWRIAGYQPARRDEAETPGQRAARRSPRSLATLELYDLTAPAGY
jgi:4-amino-4-deoxy-L-arabinose transferase-like glycosyltransferase